jgi:predicted small lipoprotein YifL
MHRHFLSSLLIAGIFALAACGSSSTPTGVAPAATAQTGGESTNNGEAAAVAYIDARFHYRIDGPGRMSASADGSASVIGPSERLVVSVVQGSSAADPAALARTDVRTMPSSAANFHLMAGPGEITLNGKKVQKFVFTYIAGTSAVTGKTLDLVGVRYYIPKDSGTVAVVTYGIVSNQYDPQGADDIALTFQWQ